MSAVTQAEPTVSSHSGSRLALKKTMYAEAHICRRLESPFLKASVGGFESETYPATVSSPAAWET